MPATYRKTNRPNVGQLADARIVVMNTNEKLAKKLGVPARTSWHRTLESLLLDSGFKGKVFPDFFLAFKGQKNSAAAAEVAVELANLKVSLKGKPSGEYNLFREGGKGAALGNKSGKFKYSKQGSAFVRTNPKGIRLAVTASMMKRFNLKAEKVSA